MNKQEFKKQRHEYRSGCARAVRNGWRNVFADYQEAHPLMVRCLPSDRPVSVRVWLKLCDMNVDQLRTE